MPPVKFIYKFNFDFNAFILTSFTKFANFDSEYA
jgi:hypothetical protein